MDTLCVAYLSSYPPRRCGIATFTQNLIYAINEKMPHRRIVIALNDVQGAYRYGQEVEFQILSDDPSTYRSVAQEVKRSGVQLVNVQHDWGLYGGREKGYLSEFFNRIELPVVTTMHGVIHPSDRYFSERLLSITQRIAEASRYVVVLTRSAMSILTEVYGVEPGKIEVIPHGVPVVGYQPALRRQMKARLGLSGRKVLSTFGLINTYKGIEHGIQALPMIVEKVPNVLYLVLGQTHPGLLRVQGESYRERLSKLAEQLGVDAYVHFENRYLPPGELLEYLLATDVYLVPYTVPYQAVSGTLAYALGLGRAVVSTPFLFAKEVLSGGCGVLVDFRDPEGIARAVVGLLSDQERLFELERKAYEATRAWVWPEVGRRYSQLFLNILGR